MDRPFQDAEIAHPVDFCGTCVRPLYASASLFVEDLLEILHEVADGTGHFFVFMRGKRQDGLLRDNQSGSAHFR